MIKEKYLDKAQQSFLILKRKKLLANLEIQKLSTKNFQQTSNVIVKPQEER